MIYNVYVYIYTHVCVWKSIQSLSGAATHLLSPCRRAFMSISIRLASLSKSDAYMDKNCAVWNNAVLGSFLDWILTSKLAQTIEKIPIQQR